MKTAKTAYRITCPVEAGGQVLEVVEQGECIGCRRTIERGEYITRKYNRSAGVQGPLCRECRPFRFVRYWDELYHEASLTPVGYTRGRKPLDAVRD